MEDFSALVDWSRAQFALTALYHWLFVPLTLGLSFIVAFMLTTYYKTGDEKWKETTKFWMKLFAINFAIGVATGIILEFEFGTNWSNYSWFVGDIFGAPLAIEGIFAFFLESTFLVVMLFGWDRVSHRFHLTATWLTAIGSNLSALWILVANAWMQDPAGSVFNPDTARNEMASFSDIVFSETAVAKFTHTLFQAYLLASFFVITVAAWYLLKKRHVAFAKNSMLIATVFGLIASVMVVLTGDQSAYNVAQKQPMKLAAMEGLYNGRTEAPIATFGYVKKGEDAVGLEIPYLLSILAKHERQAFVPGVNDLLDGNGMYGIPPAEERMKSGKRAIDALKKYKAAKDEGNGEEAEKYRRVLMENYHNFGYGFFESKEEIVPPVPLSFYTFHTMVGLGVYFVLYLIWLLYLLIKDKIGQNKVALKLGVAGIFLAYIATEAGWIVAEVGRQPWAIQDLLPVRAASSHLSVGDVQLTFFIFLVLFTALLIAEIGIMLKVIKKGPNLD